MAREEEVVMAILRAIILSANMIAIIENLARKTLSTDQALVASCFDC